MTDDAGAAGARAGRLGKLSREDKGRLFELLRAKKEREPQASLSRIAPRDRDVPAPLSFSQQRMWVLDRLAPGNPVYNVPGGIWLGGRLAGALLGRALEAVAGRHEVLRTTYEERDGQPVQVVVPSVAIPVPEIDLGALPPAACGPELVRQGELLMRQPFDLAAGPVLRAAVCFLPGRASFILFCLHHIAGDAWSLDILARELEAFYSGFVTGQPPELPELPVQYADFACWQREYLEGEVMARQLAVWRRRLAGVPETLELPADRPRPAERGTAGDMVNVVMGGEVLEPVNAACKAVSATVFMALVAAFGALLGWLGEQDDVVLGTAVANRGRPEVQPLIGFFVNTLPLRLDLSGDPTFSELLLRAREVALEAYANQDVPLERILEELPLSRSTGRQPLFQTMLTGHNVAGSEWMDSAGHESNVPIGTKTAKFDLTLSLTESSTDVSGTLEYATDLFDRTTALRLAGHFRALLAEAAAAPERRLSALGLLSPAERFQVAVEWGDAATTAPEETVVELVWRQAARDPEAPAVVGAEALTYGDLVARAEEVARLILGVAGGSDRSVGSDGSVGSVLGVVAVVTDGAPATTETVVALLAALRAGEACLLLDPAWPAERLAHLVADSGARALVGSRASLAALPAGLTLPLVEVDVGATPRGCPGGGGDALRRPLPDAPAVLDYDEGEALPPTSLAVPHRALAQLVSGVAARHGLAPGEAVATAAPAASAAAVVSALAALATGCRLVLSDPGSAAARTLATEGPAFAAAWLASDGRPLPGVRARILDARGRPAPIGVPGELALGADGVPSAIWGHPDATAERFVPDPAGDEPGGRLFATRWRARFLPTGGIEPAAEQRYRQAEIGGWRFGLGEIEAALRRHPAVESAVVLSRPDASGTPRLVAWIVPEAQGETEALAARLARALEAWLPAARVPAAFVLLASLPRAASGAVDFAALETPADLGASAPAGAAEAEADTVEMSELLETLSELSAEEVAALLAEGTDG